MNDTDKVSEMLTKERETVMWCRIIPVFGCVLKVVVCQMFY